MPKGATKPTALVLVSNVSLQDQEVSFPPKPMMSPLASFHTAKSKANLAQTWVGGIHFISFISALARRPLAPNQPVGGARERQGTDPYPWAMLSPTAKYYPAWLLELVPQWGERPRASH